MALSPVHILNQMGVITSFSVAKKISEEEVSKFVGKGKKEGKTNEEINRSLREKVVGEIEDAVVNHKIPGLLNPTEMAKVMGVKQEVIEKIPELNRLIMIVGHKMAEKKYDKMSLCYFINSLVNLLGLSESDFEKFHRQNNEGNNDDDDDGDEFQDEI